MTTKNNGPLKMVKLTPEEEAAVLSEVKDVRRKLVHRDEYVGMLSLKLGVDLARCVTALLDRTVIEVSYDVPTLATDGKSLIVNPVYWKSLEKDYQYSAVVHEVCHCVFEHPWSRGMRDPVLFNQAGDYVIHCAMTASGYKIHPEWLYDPKYNGKTTAEVYDMLVQDQQGSGGKGGKQKPNGGQWGDGSQGQKRCGGIKEGNNGEDGDLKNEWNGAVKEMARYMKEDYKNRGIGAAICKHAVEHEDSNTNWRRELWAACATTKGDDETTWARPKRRHLANGLYVPDSYSEVMGTIVFVGDSSGSMGQHFKEIGPECVAIHNQLRPERTIFIMCDYEVTPEDVRIFEREDEPDITWIRGGGGTSFVPPFEWLAKNGIKPDVLVYFTDMYGDFPSTPPDYPVYWASVTKGMKAPFGSVIYMDKAQL